MAVPWWIAIRDSGGTGFLFQAPGEAQAVQEASGSGATVFGGTGYPTRALAAAAAAFQGIRLDGSKGSPAPPAAPAPPAPTAGAGKGGKYWVTWKDESDGTAARNSAIIWGPQAGPPPQQPGWFLAGAFATKAAAQAYKAAIGKGTLAPPPGTPVFGGQHVPNPLSGIDAVGHFFTTLGDRATWVRILKVTVGAIMIIAGLVRMGAPGAEKIASKLPPIVPV